MAAQRRPAFTDTDDIGIPLAEVVALTGVKLQSWRLAIRRKAVKTDANGDPLADDVVAELTRLRGVRLAEASDCQRRADFERQRAEAFSLAAGRVVGWTEAKEREADA